MQTFQQAYLSSALAKMASHGLLQHESSRLHLILVKSVPIVSSKRLQSTGGYGDGAGDPRGENPMAQGVSSVTRELEHPGECQFRSGQSADLVLLREQRNFMVVHYAYVIALIIGPAPPNSKTSVTKKSGKTAGTDPSPNQRLPPRTAKEEPASGEKSNDQEGSDPSI